MNPGAVQESCCQADRNNKEAMKHAWSQATVAVACTQPSVGTLRLSVVFSQSQVVDGCRSAYRPSYGPLTAG